MVDTHTWILDHIDLVVAIVVVLVFVLLLLFLIASFRLGAIRRRYKSLMKGIKNANLEDVLHKYANDVHQLQAEVQSLKAKNEHLQHELQISPGPLGVVRYNAFPDAGSDLSYSIAILNRNGDGVVFTSIFGREESRSYAKPLTATASTYHLSEEEKEAIRLATEKMK
ncbi:MAG TPA: DUF4446 family protein [Bacilli bacterium]|nr:DUF4446 family protein [Bacilli bacterium]